MGRRPSELRKRVVEDCAVITPSNHRLCDRLGIQERARAFEEYRRMLENSAHLLCLVSSDPYPNRAAPAATAVPFTSQPENSSVRASSPWGRLFKER